MDYELGAWIAPNWFHAALVMRSRGRTVLCKNMASIPGSLVLLLTMQGLSSYGRLVLTGPW